MDVEMTKSNYTFTFKFDGDNEIDALILSKTINNLVGLIKISSEIENPGIITTVKISTLKQGSFGVDFNTICQLANTLLLGTQNFANFAHNAIYVVECFFKIKSHLKGAPAKSMELKPDHKADIENCYGDKLEVPINSTKIIRNVYIDNLTQNISYNVRQHNPNGGFSFIDGGKNLIFTSEDVKNISTPLIDKDSFICKKYLKKVSLPIKKADILGSSKWSFILDNTTIEASISDEKFLEQIHAGKTVAAGDYINATLETCVNLNDLNEPIKGTEKYTVLEVHGDIKHNDSQFKFDNF